MALKKTIARRTISKSYSKSSTVKSSKTANPKLTMKEKIKERQKKSKAKKNRVLNANPEIDSIGKAAFNWFPGHMLKAMEEIKAKMKMVDLVIEIRDARVPLLSGNQSLTEAINGKSRLIVLNKSNLANTKMMEEWSTWFKKEGVPFIFINCLDKGSMQKVLPLARKIIQDKRLQNNLDKANPSNKLRFMVIGLPNTGKSTFINQLSSRNASKTANKPGQTRVPLWVNVDENLELLDTPGVMHPEIETDEHRQWLKIINAIPDEIAGVEDPACFLVRYFLKEKSNEFQERYKIDSLDISLEEALLKIATVRGCLMQKGLPDLDRVYKLILMDFRVGELGQICFGHPPL